MISNDIKCDITFVLSPLMGLDLIAVVDSSYRSLIRLTSSSFIRHSLPSCDHPPLGEEVEIWWISSHSRKMFTNDEPVPSYSRQDPNLPPVYTENYSQESQSHSPEVQDPAPARITPAPNQPDHDHLFVRIDPELPPLSARFPQRTQEREDDWVERLESLYRITYSSVPAWYWTVDMCRKWIFELLSTDMPISSTIAHQTAMKWAHGDLCTFSVESLNSRLGERSGTIVYNRLCELGLSIKEPPKASEGTKGMLTTRNGKMVMQRTTLRTVEDLRARRGTHPHLFNSRDPCVSALYQRFPRTEREAEKEWIERLEALHNITHLSVPAGDWKPDMCQKWIFELLARVMPSEETAYLTGQKWKGDGRDLFNTDEQTFRKILGWGGQCVYEAVAKLYMDKRGAGHGKRLQ